MTFVVDSGHAERCLSTRGGGYHFDRLIACAVWNLFAAGAQVRARLLRSRIRLRQDRSKELLHRQCSTASRLGCDQPFRFGSNDGCAGVHLSGRFLCTGRAREIDGDSSALSAHRRIHLKNLNL
jgi:hypothetical protein